MTRSHLWPMEDNVHLMALDIGERRIGIAISTSGILASPHSVIHRTSKKKDFVKLQRLIAELEIERLIVGLPYSLSGHESLGPQARRVMRYTEALAEHITIPYEYFDESYSTVDASALQASSGSKRIPIDAAAAAVILQNYLNAAGNSE
ncbi:MAG: Holliday junction resolvase RuvX [Anaerolineae bacterium]|nr:Holliday junction resolvase RuvX [Anaerolineae bacterium]